MQKGRLKPGKSLEELVASIERALAHNEKVSVESPVHLPDRVTGEQREHDVLITVSGSHHTVKIAIECRDRSRKITVNGIEGFWSKCKDTGVDQGIVVSPKGFTEAALAKAKHHGIRCLQLTEAKAFNWLLAAGITSRTRKTLHTSWKFLPDLNGAQPPKGFTILTPAGDPVQGSNLVAAAVLEFQKIPDTEFQPGMGKKRIVFTSPGLNLRDDDTGTIYKVGQALADVHYEIVEEFIPFKLHTYATSPDGEQITDAAVAELDLGGIKGKMMIVYKEGEGGHVVFVPEKKAARA
ncbi:MAG TPA: restriction endonuclease [Burkholderiaceae bacterium]|nr:restriction endonuclease [Burkholderiaceae bacterium]